ncbi:domain found in IF2B/IF5-domain-containing protein [Rhizophagus diaphanus]|nr:domain found in IF2B/IF5-domain-containing protein [Rhizophagus diaphanus] [Rhizophagus sp. MUCL 43196]
MSDIENDQQEKQNLEEEKSEELLFDPSLKKKKKKKKAVIFEDEIENDEDAENQAENGDKSAEANEEEVKAEDDDISIFADMKKKKKKKKEAADKEKTEEDAAEPSEFGDLPAKRKKKKKTDMLEFEKQLKEGDGDENRPDDDIFVGEGEQDVKEIKVEEAWLNSDRDYTYQELLGRVFQILRQNNPELAGEKKRYTIVPPSVHREGNKKTIFANVADICKRMHRQPEHVIQFLFTELGTSGSIDGSQRLVIKGRFQQKQIENVLRRYIVEYVTCKTCKSPDTILTKENRIFFQQCESCGSTRSVSAIKSGFKAQTEKRRRQAAQ